MTTEVEKEVNRDIEVEGVMCNFKKDRMYSFWSVTIGGKTKLDGVFTSLPKATLAVKEYLHNQTKSKKAA